MAHIFAIFQAQAGGQFFHSLLPCSPFSTKNTFLKSSNIPVGKKTSLYSSEPPPYLRAPTYMRTHIGYLNCPPYRHSPGVLFLGLKRPDDVFRIMGMTLSVPSFHRVFFPPFSGEVFSSLIRSFSAHEPCSFFPHPNTFLNDGRILLLLPFQ